MKKYLHLRHAVSLSNVGVGVSYQRAFENVASRKKFVPKRDAIIAGWRKLHNEDFRDLYCS
jgi:hypothetical protein